METAPSFLFLFSVGSRQTASDASLHAMTWLSATMQLLDDLYLG